MKRYDLVEIQSDDYQYFIFSTCAETPFASLNEITTELQEHREAGIKVIFDMLMNLGNSSDRYVEAYFNGTDFEKESFNNVKVNKSSTLREISCFYYRSHPQILNKSILNSMQKNMISKGLAI
jgi:hypothetical protein